MLSKEILIEMQEFVQNHKFNFVFDKCEAPKYLENDLMLDIEPNELEKFIKENQS